MSFSRLKTLLLYAQYTNKLSYYDDWKDAFSRAPQFDVDAINICDRSNIQLLEQSIQQYDFVVVLHSAIGDTLDFINPYRKSLTARKCKMLSFVANEVNLPLPSSMQQKIEFFGSMGTDYIATQLPLEAGQWVYEDCKQARVVAVPHALNPESFKPLVLQKDRRIDIGVRSHKYLPYLGDNERNELLDFFAGHKFDPPLRIDINLNNRFDRTDWAGFLNSSKATLANEAGTYYLEKDDRTVNAISGYILENLQRVSSVIKPLNENNFFFKIRMMAPPSLRALYKRIFGYGNSSDLAHYMRSEIQDIFFKNYIRPPVYTKAISSRHFDAIGTKTLQIMLPGKYNNILKPDVHYIELKKDFSNIGEVMKKFRDLEYRNKIVDGSYDYVMEHHTHQHRIREIAKIAVE